MVQFIGNIGAYDGFNWFKYSEMEFQVEVLLEKMRENGEDTFKILFLSIIYARGTYAFNVKTLLTFDLSSNIYFK